MVNAFCVLYLASILQPLVYPLLTTLVRDEHRTTTDFGWNLGPDAELKGWGTLLGRLATGMIARARFSNFLRFPSTQLCGFGVR
jgi:hypothetical protein